MYCMVKAQFFYQWLITVVCPQGGNTELGRCFTVGKEAKEAELLKTAKKQSTPALINACFGELKNTRNSTLNEYIIFAYKFWEKAQLWTRITCSSAHMSSAHYQMEYTLKGCTVKT